MKNFVKIFVCVTMLCSVALMAYSIWTHTTNDQVLILTVLLLMAGGSLGALYALISCTKLQARKIRNGSSNIPMWKCLGFLIVEVVLAMACIYLLFHIWSVRDMLNAELATLLSGCVVYWLTHSQSPEKSAEEAEN